MGRAAGIGLVQKHKTSNTQTLHVCHICLRWGGGGGQCRHILHTWSVWDITIPVPSFGVWLEVPDGGLGRNQPGDPVHEGAGRIKA